MDLRPLVLRKQHLENVVKIQAVRILHLKDAVRVLLKALADIQGSAKTHGLLTEIQTKAIFY
jgi:hypothetical protein